MMYVLLKDSRKHYVAQAMFCKLRNAQVYMMRVDKILSCVYQMDVQKRMHVCKISVGSD